MAQKRRRKKPLTLHQVRGSVSAALIQLESIYLNSDDHDLTIRACNSLSTIANSYVKLTETADLEQRIQDLETELNKGTHG